MAEQNSKTEAEYIVGAAIIVGKLSSVDIARAYNDYTGLVVNKDLCELFEVIYLGFERERVEFIDGKIDGKIVSCDK